MRSNSSPARLALRRPSEPRWRRISQPSRGSEDRSPAAICEASKAIRFDPEVVKRFKDCGVAHRNEARAFLRLESDEVINQAFELTQTTTLYGRKAVISDPQGKALSEIVEILPP